jgi:hypothetical protein
MQTNFASPQVTQPQPPVGVATNQAKESPLSLPVQKPNAAEWQTVTHPSGVLFRIPINWQTRIHTIEDDSLSMHLAPDIPGSSEWPIYISITSLPKDQEATLYRFAGEVVSNGEGWAPTQIVWDKQATFNGIQWHLRMEGESKGVFRGYYLDGVESLAQKGAITEGTIIAVHYIEEKESYLFLSRNLDREMLITLDQDGGDAVWSKYLQTFAEILAGITISDTAVTTSQAEESPLPFPVQKPTMQDIGVTDHPAYSEIASVLNKAYDLFSTPIEEVDIERFAEVLIDTPDFPLTAEQQADIGQILGKEAVEGAGYLTAIQAKHVHLQHGADMLKAAQEKATAEGRAITPAEMETIKSQNYGAYPPSLETPEHFGKRPQLQYLSLEVTGDRATVVYDSGTALQKATLVKIEGQWLIASNVVLQAHY